MSKTTCLRFHAILPKFCGALSPSTATEWLLLIGSPVELHRQRAHFANRSKAVPAGLTLLENSQGFQTLGERSRLRQDGSREAPLAADPM